MDTKVNVVLTKAEIEELLLTTSFEREVILHLKDNFARMQSDPVVCGKVSLPELCKFLKIKDECLFAKKLFDRLDINRDGQLTFFDILNSMDNLHQREFKSKLKFYFELFCDEDKTISRAKLLKISKEVLSALPHLTLPDDFFLEKSKAEIKPAYASAVLQRRNSVASKDHESQKEEEAITLDEFFDHFEKVYPALV